MKFSRLEVSPIAPNATFSWINVITNSIETLVNWGAKEVVGVYCSEKDKIYH